MTRAELDEHRGWAAAAHPRDHCPGTRRAEQPTETGAQYGMSSLPSIASHHFAAPTAADALAALTRVVGAERAEALWAEACGEAAVATPRERMSIAEIGSVAERLVARGGAVQSVAQAILIRLRTYNRLAARARESAPATVEIAR